MFNNHKNGNLLFLLILTVLLSINSASCDVGIKTTVKDITGTTLPISSTPLFDGQTLQVKVHVLPTATPTATIVSTATSALSSSSSPSDGRFSTLPPYSSLPGDADCASRVRRSAWESRPSNTTANHTNVYAQGYRLMGSYLEQYGYEQRVTGDFTGTTDEIFQWGACKWGFDEDTVRAQAVMESRWNQLVLGDCDGVTVAETHGCQSVGILQVKGANIPPTHPGTWPYARQSTAFNVDYTLAVRRACFEGKETWLGNGYYAGDLWGCIGRWFSGDWYGEGSLKYIAGVKSYLANKVWLGLEF